MVTMMGRLANRHRTTILVALIACSFLLTGWVNDRQNHQRDVAACHSAEDTRAVVRSALLAFRPLVGPSRFRDTVDNDIHRLGLPVPICRQAGISTDRG